jgi:hypothetical protein
MSINYCFFRTNINFTIILIQILRSKCTIFVEIKKIHNIQLITELEFFIRCFFTVHISLKKYTQI